MKFATTTLTGLAVTAAPALAAEAGHDWSGLYAGANAGYERMLSDANVLSGSTRNYTGIGALGMMGGYNFQSGNWVAGLEADASLLSGKIDNLDSESDAEAQWTVRARAGFASGDRLYYLTGGPAWMKSKCNTCSADTDTYKGYQLGAGFEQAVTGNVSVRAEYLYTDFARQPIANDTSYNSALSSHAVRVGVAYQF